MLIATINPYSDDKIENVECKINPMDWQKQGLSFTASGFGNRIPTEYMIKVANRWRRVYCRIFSNSGTLYIGKNLKEGSIVDIERR